LVAKDHIQEPFIVINADDLYGPDAYKQMSSFLSHINEKQIAMVGYVLENTISEV
jgi:choline kinase